MDVSVSSFYHILKGQSIYAHARKTVFPEPDFWYTVITDHPEAHTFPVVYIFLSDRRSEYGKSIFTGTGQLPPVPCRL